MDANNEIIEIIISDNQKIYFKGQNGNIIPISVVLSLLANNKAKVVQETVEFDLSKEYCYPTYSLFYITKA
jgi:hypothetical protein